MKDRKMAGALLSIALCIPLLAGCARTLQAKKVDVGNTILVNPAVLQKGGDDQALYRYMNPAADFRKYTKVIIDPVIMYQEVELDAETKENYQKLVNNGYVYLVQELRKDHAIVLEPGPDTMRVQFAIVQAEPSGKVRNFTSTVLPIGMVVSAVKYGATGKPTAVGDITGEVKMTDTMTGQLLGAALDRRVGGKELKGVFDTWQDADAALLYWAQKIRYVLCTQRGGTSCVKPG